jgi:prepilin-type N-terminal cleavage/methylation domain-containing protein
MVRKGFSLLEVGVALLILGLAVTAVFQFLSSTTLSALNLENRAYASARAINGRQAKKWAGRVWWEIFLLVGANRNNVR